MWQTPLKNIKKIAEKFKFESFKGLGENIGNHIIGRDIFDLDVTLINSLSYKMKVNVNMFCVSMKTRVLQQFNCALVVAVKDSW